MDEQLNITATSGKAKEKEGKSIDKLLSLINKNTNRKGTETTKRLDSLLITDNKILEAVKRIKATDKEKEKKVKKVDEKTSLRSQLSDFFAKQSEQLSKKDGLFNKMLSKSMSYTSGILKPKGEEDDNVESQEESKDRAEEEKKESKWEKFRTFVMDKLGLASAKDKVKDIAGNIDKQLQDYGLVGKFASGFLKFIPWVFKNVGKFLFKGLPKAIGKVFGFIMKPIGLVAKVLGFVFKGIGSVIFGIIKAIAGVVGWPALIIAGIAAIGYLVYKYWDEIKEAFGDFFGWLADVPGELWDWLRSKLPRMLGGMSSEEKEQYEKDKATKEALKEKGVSRSNRNDYIEEQKKRREAGLDEQDYETWQANQVANGKIDGAYIGNTEETRKIAREQAKKKYADATQQAKTSVEKPADIEIPEWARTESKEEKPSQSTNTVIINESNPGVEVSDYIGTASSVVSTMTRT